MDEPADQWTRYLSPKETWDAMYEDCSAALQSIEMEQYIFHNDEIGQKFMHLFIKKAKEGLHVRVLCDDVGSGSFHKSPLVSELREAGGIFHFYNSIKLVDVLKPRRLFPRTHLKVLAIDSAIGYIGGVCIAKRMERWRDTQIRITGSVADQMRQALDRNSQELLGPKANKHKRWVEPIMAKNSEFSYMQNDPAFFRHPIYRSILREINEARSFVYISAAFFVPTWKLRRSLRRAALRGVQTIVLIPQKSDSDLADWACLSYVAKLVKDGVKIFRYQPTVLHTKTVVIDGKWGTIGSCNFDPLSFFHNREANLIIRSAEVLAQMKEDFEKDLKQSRELTREVFVQIPLWKRVAAHFARLLYPIL